MGAILDLNLPDGYLRSDSSSDTEVAAAIRRSKVLVVRVQKHMNRPHCCGGTSPCSQVGPVLSVKCGALTLSPTKDRGVKS